MSKELHNLIKLLDQEVTLENDEQLLSEISEIREGLPMSETKGFSIGFSDKLQNQLFAEKESFEGKLVYMFKRMAIPAAAAILLLAGINLFNANSLKEAFTYQAQLDEQVVNGDWDWTEDFD